MNILYFNVLISIDIQTHYILMIYITSFNYIDCLYIFLYIFIYVYFENLVSKHKICSIFKINETF